ncbi:MAG TPA: TadE/TadG family type IV pilus assembly protein [Pirellulaceae bacterium]|nr:TadE/TadG family type IV pilus assembly protein [Pirellulaceae bacterium]
MRLQTQPIHRQRPTAHPRHRSPVRAGRLRRAAAAVEFAIVLPLLITVFLGMTDFGRFGYSAIALANSARSGAAYASMNPYDSSNQAAWHARVRQAAVDELSQSPAFDASKLTITATSTPESSGLRRVSVVAAYPFETIISWPLVPNSIDLKQTVVMREMR